MSAVRSTLSHWSRTELVPSLPARRVLGVAVFALLTALSAKVSVLIPGTPVPFTFQPMVVLLCGALLGARMGAASQTAYLLAGAAGLPVFAAGGGIAYLMGPTGGYLLAYPLAAFVVGSLVKPQLPRILLALLAGLAVIYAGGAAWLQIVLPGRSSVALGILPFLLADLVKVLLATVVVSRLLPWATRRMGER